MGRKVAVMELAGKILVHQVHPAKITADVTASVVSSTLLWQGEPKATRERQPQRERSSSPHESAVFPRKRLVKFCTRRLRGNVRHDRMIR
jgi:hypothetical protein